MMLKHYNLMAAVYSPKTEGKVVPVFGSLPPATSKLKQVTVLKQVIELHLKAWPSVCECICEWVISPGTVFYSASV